MDRGKEQYYLIQLGVEGVVEEVSWDTEWLDNIAPEDDDKDDGEILNVKDDEHDAYESEERLMYEDPRWHLLPFGLARLILMAFGGDLDAAMAKADHLCHLYAQPPDWACKLHVMHMNYIRKPCTCWAFKYG
jgi:hypothetical protein